MLLSPDGFNSRIWGPHLWFFMHILSMNYPLIPTIRQAKAYYSFFNSLCIILPCATCREEFCAMVTRPGPFELTFSKFEQFPFEKPGAARKRLVNYVIDMHNRVNRRLGKVGSARKSRQYWVNKYARLRGVLK